MILSPLAKALLSWLEDESPYRSQTTKALDFQLGQCCGGEDKDNVESAFVELVPPLKKQGAAEELRAQAANYRKEPACPPATESEAIEDGVLVNVAADFEERAAELEREIAEMK